MCVCVCVCVHVCVCVCACMCVCFTDLQQGALLSPVALVLVPVARGARTHLRRRRPEARRAQPEVGVDGADGRRARPQ